MTVYPFFFSESRGIFYALALFAATYPAKVAPAAEAPIDYVARLGLFAAEHTASDGHQESALWQMSPSGVTAGTSVRFNNLAPSSPRGLSTWLADPSGNTVRVGFTNAAHTDVNGVQRSEFADLNASGVAVGYSDNYPGGRSAWLASIGGGTIRLGLVDGIHAPDTQNPAPFSDVFDVNEHGVAVGFSRRQDGGQTAWIDDGVNEPIVIGLYGAENTDANGVQTSSAFRINNAGYVLGTSWREKEDYEFGTEGWLRTPEGEYRTYSGGRFGGAVSLLTESGYYAIGESDPSSSFAYVAHVSGSIRKVGLNTASREDGVWNSDSVRYLTESGSAAGYYSTYSLRGNIAWVDSVTYGTREIGLSDYGQGGPGGGQEYLVGMNASGLVVGYSTNPSDDHAGWVADTTGATTRVGLYDGIFLGGPGTYSPAIHHTVTSGVNDAGQVWGASMRYHGDVTTEGQTAWIYHSADQTYTTFDLSVRASDGYAFSQINRVLDNGVALGTYTRFAGDGTDLGDRAFVWIPGQGALDVGDNLEVTLEAAGWEYLANAQTGLSEGLFAGHGVPSGATADSNGVYLAKLTGEDVPPPPPPSNIEYIRRLGFYDERHTHDSGYRSSNVLALTESGYSLGTSALFVGAEDVPGTTGRIAQTAWIGNAAGSTLRIGLYDARHTRDDGRQETTPIAINEGGVTIGSSTRFNGHDYAGETAWVANRHGGLVKVGFYDSAHSGADGVKISRPVALNNANRLIGYSLHPDTLATSAWLATSTGSIWRIGLLDAAHTAPDGTRVSLPVAINDAGYVVGISEFYVNGLAEAGTTTWLRHPSGAMRTVGLQTGVHRAPNGLHHGEIVALSANGYIAGHATRYHPTRNQPVGQTAWLTPVAQPNRRVGFYTGLHAGANNIAHSEIVSLNDAGYAIGHSAQFPYLTTNPSAARGQTAWIARPDRTTVVVGLYGNPYSAGPFQTNRVLIQNQTDGAAGIVLRVQGTGTDAWVARASGFTYRVGLDGARYLGSNQRAWHRPTHLTDTGWVAGTSARFNGSAEIGQTAWIYQRSSNTYTAINLSVRSTDGFAWSLVTDLRDDGTAVGLYRKFSSTGSSLGDRAFMFIPGRGAFDIGSALDVNIPGRGWALLARPKFFNDQGYLTGVGVLEGYGPGAPPRQFAQGVYLLRAESD